MTDDFVFGDLDDMVAELNAASAVYRPSAFWEELCATNVAMIRAHGVKNFKLSLAQNYFNWLVTSPRDRQLLRVLRLWLSHPHLSPWMTRLGDVSNVWTTTSEKAFEFTWRQRQVYRIFVGMLWNHMLSIDRTGLGSTLEEPLIGNPIPVTYRGRRISQDLANSIIEYNTLLTVRAGKPLRNVAELGAGYGRVAHVLLSGVEQCRYCVFDIPPSLMVSQWYLQKILPDKKVFRFRHFERISDVWEEFERSAVAFFTPNQLEQFPEGFFDLILSISTFPEMRSDQVDHYFQLFSRVGGGHIFIKQWKNWKNPIDGSHVTSDSYRLPPPWRCTFDRPDPTLPYFFNKAWSRE